MVILYMTDRVKNQVVMLMVALLLTLSLPTLAQSFSRREVSETPYDIYLDSFRSVASRSPGAGPLAMASVQEWLEKANDIRYNHIEAYRPRSPEEVEASGYGDCKDKALWLFAKLSAAGAHNVQLVIGKKDSQAEEFHAWLYLTLGDCTYLLDPTANESFCETSDFGVDEYIPIYAYDHHGAYVYETAVTGLTSAVQDPTQIPSVADP